jgi:hypothetical protein
VWWWLTLIGLTILVGIGLAGLVLTVGFFSDEAYVTPEEIYHEVDEAIGRVVDYVAELPARVWAKIKALW